MKRYWRDYLVLLAIAGPIIALDQWTKWLIREALPLGGTWLPAGWDGLAPYARIIHWYNTGAAFGLFQNGSTVFMILAFIVAGLIVYYYPRIEQPDWTLRIAMGMQFAGAVGNLIDRILRDGQVTDFISVGSFPVFNVADSSISVGVAILLLGVWIREWQEKKARETGSAEGQSDPGGDGQGIDPAEAREQA